MSNECMSLPPLKPCPFCGGEATFGKVCAYLSEGRNVKCVKCGARSNSYLIDTPKMTLTGADDGTRLTVEQAKEKAAAAWNRRAGESNV